MTKKLLFVTGTRADFGKLKSLLKITSGNTDFEVHIFATGMHLQELYGYTFHEIEKSGFNNLHRFPNHTKGAGMDLTMAATIEGLSAFVAQNRPDMIVVHGDRGEALAGALVGAFNNILVAHIEGGEVSGTVDELIRHAVTKMSHLHFVANDEARKRLIQMGEVPESIHVIGSPDLDIMVSDSLPEINHVREYYNIPFETYAILMFHPVTTELKNMKQAARNLFEAAKKSEMNYVVIYPNNDHGSKEILEAIAEVELNSSFRVFPSIRFEYFLTLLKNSRFIIGNSSAGIREAPFYGVPTVNIGSRQNGRSMNSNIIHTDYDADEILSAIIQVLPGINFSPDNFYGDGASDIHFLETLLNPTTWLTKTQKTFLDYQQFER